MLFTLIVRDRFKNLESNDPKMKVRKNQYKIVLKIVILKCRFSNHFQSTSKSQNHVLHKIPNYFQLNNWK